MRMTKLLRKATLLGGVLVGTATANASGGPVEEMEYQCSASSAYVRIRLHQAYTSEMRGDVLVYKSKTDLGNEVTSMETCFEAKEGTVTPALDPTINVDGLVVCGSRDTAAPAART